MTAANVLRAALCAVLLSSALGCAARSARRPATPSATALTPAQLLRRGLDYEARGDLVRAEQYLASALGADRAAAQVLPALLRVCVKAGRLRRALRYGRHALRQRPDDWRLRQLVATLHLGLGELERAHQELLEVVRRAPGQPLPHFALAVLLRERLGRSAQAAPHFARYLALDPGGPHAAHARAALASAAGPGVYSVSPAPGAPGSASQPARRVSRR